MSAAATIRPSDLLTSTETQALGRRSDWVGAALVLHAWAVVGGAMALFALWPNPLTFLLGVVVVGTRQLGMAILMHDAAHGLLFRSRALNDSVGQWLCAWPVWTSLTLYRPYHLKHHRFTQQPEDPDLGLSAPFPITWASFRRKAIRDLTGQTAYQRRKAQILGGMGDRSLPLATRLANLWRREKGAFAVNATLFAACAACGVWWVYPLLWLLPLFTWHQLVVRVRNIAEHAMVSDNDDSLRNTRTTLASWIERALVAPYWVNYHLEHHLLLFVPCWRLPAAHAALLAKGHGPRMELTRGYRAVMRLACSRTEDGPRDALRQRGMQHI